MRLFDNHLTAIFAAQSRMVINRGPTSALWFWLLSAVWYICVAFGAAAIAALIPTISNLDSLERFLSGGLLLGLIIWQLLPLVLVSAGMNLELRRLLVYPIPISRLFGIEVLLRVTTGVEILILLAGAAVGLWQHPKTPWYGPFSFLLFAAFNMLLAAGLRDLLTRLLARRGIRELVVLGFVLLMALPQLLVVMIPPDTWKRESVSALLDRIPAFPWPWQITAALAVEGVQFFPLVSLVAWTVLVGWFGYTQFKRGLRWDADEVRAKQRQTLSPRAANWTDHLYRLPARFLPDPLGSLVEKEIRSLMRAPRFRLVFFMGFTFGLIIWAPLLLGRNRGGGFMGENILVWVSIYAALLLGEALFWNVFGFDRHAMQAYYILPVRPSTVLIGKNITAVILLLLEISIVAAVCTLLRFPVTGAKIAECFAVTIMLSLFLMAAGNLASTHFPRAANPTNTWRNTSSGKVQFMLMLVYPMVGIPISLAYLARYAFETQAAFYVVLAAGFIVAGLTYYVALGSSVEALDRRKEQILAELSRGDGLLGA